MALDATGQDDVGRVTIIRASLASRAHAEEAQRLNRGEGSGIQQNRVANWTKGCPRMIRAV